MNATARLVNFCLVQWEGASEVTDYSPGFADEDYDLVTKSLDEVAGTTEKAKEFYTAKAE